MYCLAASCNCFTVAVCMCFVGVLSILWRENGMLVTFVGKANWYLKNHLRSSL